MEVAHNQSPVATKFHIFELTLAKQRFLMDSFCSVGSFNVNSEPPLGGTSLGPLVCGANYLT
jgi:hypothetical protein